MNLTGDDALYNLSFNLGISDRKPMEEKVIDTVRQFDRMYVALFTSGGDYLSLRGMPAADLLKRRLVQDVNSWSAQGRILSHDRHALNINKVDMISSHMATVETAESWVLILRDRQTGRRMKNQKQNQVRVRYILREYDAGWKVLDFEVYTPESGIPPLAEIWRRVG
jgi:hypothetical protein